MADGSITIDTKLNSDGIKNGLSKIGGIAKGALKGVAVAGVAVTAAFAGIVTASVKARGELEQQIGGTEAVFGEFAKQVQEQSKKAYSSMGLSANDYMATINKMSSLMQGSGITQAESLDLASKAMQRAADVASIMGIDVASAMEAVNGAAKGNFTMMDNLGVAMNATTLESYALEKGLNKTYAQMSNAEKVQLAMEMFLEKSAYAAGNYAKENETLAGSMTTLKAAWDNFLSGAGDLSQVVDSAEMALESIMRTVNEAIPQIVDNLVAALPQLIELTSKILSNIIDGLIKNLPTLMKCGKQILESLAQGIIAFLPELIPIALDIIQMLIDGIVSFLPQILEVATKIIQTLITGIIEILPQLIPMALQIVQTLFNAIIENLPQLIEAGIQLIQQLIVGIAQMLPTLIPQAIDCILTIVIGLLDNIDLIVDAGIELIMGLAEGLIEALPIIIDKAPEIIEKLVSALIKNQTKIIEAGIKLLIALAGGLIKAIPQLISKIPEIISAMVRGFLDGISQITNIGKNMIEGLWNGIQGAAGWIKDKVSGFAKGVLDGMKSALGIHSPSTLFRDQVGKNIALGVGEGFEDNISKVYRQMKSAVDFETQKLSTNLSATAMMSKVITANINVNGSVDMDGTKVGRLVAPSVSRTLRTAGA